jgi:uncharacterized protein (DUF362 family)/ferredoxin
MALKEKIKASLVKYFPLQETLKGESKILLKPNLLMEAKPEEAITTHPALVEAVGEIYKETGKNVFIADSPGGFISQKAMDEVYEKTGMVKISQRTGFGLLYPTQNVITKDIPLCWWAAGTLKGAADNFKMINIAKLKTHDVMVLTLATKNLYGCISGLHKSHLHKLYPKTKEFTAVILKLYEIIKPQLNIVDGILALEGSGPAKGGTPRKLGMLILGDDCLYTDYVISKILGVSDKHNPLIKEAKLRGLLNEDELEFISELGDKTINDFKLPAPFIINTIPEPLLNLIKPLLGFRPKIDLKKCENCQKCLQVCPASAIRYNKIITIDYKKCIMCMCCSEICPHGAIGIKQNFLIRLVIRLVKRIEQCFR